MKSISVYVYLHGDRMHNMLAFYQTCIVPQKGDIYAKGLFDKIDYEVMVKERLLHVEQDNLLSIVVEPTFPNLVPKTEKPKTETV